MNLLTFLAFISGALLANYSENFAIINNLQKVTNNFVYIMLAASFLAVFFSLGSYFSVPLSLAAALINGFASELIIENAACSGGALLKSVLPLVFLTPAFFVACCLSQRLSLRVMSAAAKDSSGSEKTGRMLVFELMVVIVALIVLRYCSRP